MRGGLRALRLELRLPDTAATAPAAPAAPASASAPSADEIFAALMGGPGMDMGLGMGMGMDMFTPPILLLCDDVARLETDVAALAARRPTRAAVTSVDADPAPADPAAGGGGGEEEERPQAKCGDKRKKAGPGGAPKRVKDVGGAARRTGKAEAEEEEGQPRLSTGSTSSSTSHLSAASASSAASAASASSASSSSSSSTGVDADVDEDVDVDEELVGALSRTEQQVAEMRCALLLSLSPSLSPTCLSPTTLTPTSLSPTSLSSLSSSPFHPSPRWRRCVSAGRATKPPSRHVFGPPGNGAYHPCVAHIQSHQPPAYSIQALRGEVMQLQRDRHALDTRVAASDASTTATSATSAADAALRKVCVCVCGGGGGGGGGVRYGGTSLDHP